MKHFQQKFYSKERAHVYVHGLQTNGTMELKYCHVQHDDNEKHDSIIWSIPFNNNVTENLFSTW